MSSATNDATSRVDARPDSDASLSVILPNYNHSDYIDGALEAIFSQSLLPTEVIIIDDGSTDQSLPKLRQFASRESRVLLLENPKNRGTNYSVRMARERASGKYVYFAAMDDRVLPGLFETSISLLEKFPTAGFCTSLTRTMSTDGSDLGIFPTPPITAPDGYISPDMAKNIILDYDSWFRCNTAIYRRQTLEAEGGFDPQLGPFADGFLCMMMSLRDGCCFIPHPMGSIRVSDDNQSILVGANFTKSSEIFGYARMLMDTKYQNYFPDDLVRRWDARWRSAVAQNIFQTHGTAGFDDIAALLKASPALQRVLFNLVRRMPEISDRWMPSLLKAVFTPGDILRSKLRSF